MSQHSFVKLVAAGNDFLFLDYSQDTEPKVATEAIAKVCDRHFGIGADGLVFMKRHSEFESTWHFFNSDGSKAAMCGNAARASAEWLRLQSAKFPHRLNTAFGAVTLDFVSEGIYSAEVNYRHAPLTAQKLEADVFLVDTGVPHVVVQTGKEVLKMRDRNSALLYRWPKEAGAGGANVTFYRRLSSKEIEAVTFERGVEDFTLSCGTGVLAAALIASGALASKTWPSSGISVRNPGGQLQVKSPDFPNSLVLIGPAQIVFHTNYKIELFGI